MAWCQRFSTICIQLYVVDCLFPWEVVTRFDCWAAGSYQSYQSFLLTGNEEGRLNIWDLCQLGAYFLVGCSTVPCVRLLGWSVARTIPWAAEVASPETRKLVTKNWQSFLVFPEKSSSRWLGTSADTVRNQRPNGEEKWQLPCDNWCFCLQGCRFEWAHRDLQISLPCIALVCFRVICRMQNVCITVFSPKKETWSVLVNSR